MDPFATENTPLSLPSSDATTGSAADIKSAGDSMRSADTRGNAAGESGVTSDPSQPASPNEDVRETVEI